MSQWTRCAPLLAPAIEHGGEFTLEDIEQAVSTNRATLWPGVNAAFVTQLVSGDTPYILVWLAGGDLDELLSMQPGMEAWARAQGAEAARVNGRGGWRRALKAGGFIERDGELWKGL